MKKVNIVWGVSGLVVIGIVVVAFFRLRNPAGRMETRSVQRGKIVESVYGIGTVTAARSYQLRLGVSNSIQHLYVKEGDNVKKGDRIIDFDQSGGFRAPFSGTVTQLPVKVGEIVFAQGLILSLVDLADRDLVVSLEQRAVLRVRQGQEARVSFENLREQTFYGKTESIYSNEAGFLVRIQVPHLPPQILPGMTADVAIGIRTLDRAILVPVVSIQSGQVVRIRSGSKKTIPVKVGVVDGAMAEVLEGDLTDGDLVASPKGGVL